MDTALRIFGRWATLLAILFVLTAANVLLKQLTGFDGRFVVGWLTAVAFFSLFPSMRPWSHS